MERQVEKYMFPFDIIAGTNKEHLSRLQPHQDLYIAVSGLIRKYPEVSNFFYKYFKERPLLFEGLDACCPPHKKRKMDRACRPPIDLVLAAIRLLYQDAKFFTNLLDWSPVVGLLRHSNDELRWLACYLLSIIAGLPPAEVLRWQKSLVPNQLPHLLKYERLFLALATQHEKKVLKLSKDLKDLQNNSACIGARVTSGVLLPLSDSPKQSLPPFHTDSPSIQATLQSMALGIAAGQPLLLQGPIGSGKTSLIVQLANMTRKSSQLVKVQLGDQMDSKMLIGSYCCTKIPGEFVWHAGPLTRAMEQGCWLVLEDVDYAPMDVVSLLVPVLQSRTLVLPGRAQPLHAAPGFHILATKRLVAGETRFYSESSSHADVLCKLWKKISVMPLSKHDLRSVILACWPNLEPLIPTILEIYFIFSHGGHDGEYDEKLRYRMTYSHGQRSPSTRDLVKLCQRISCYYSPSNPNKRAMMKNVFMDFFDIFANSVQHEEFKLQQAHIFGEYFGFNNGEVTSHFDTYIPQMALQQETLSVGRVTLPILPVSREHKRVKVTFAQTRQAMCALESISMALANKEPALLVGETGIGKTSMVQYLANITNNNLTVINMNQQSDSIDLLGGYKPVELKSILKPFLDQFLPLFLVAVADFTNGTVIDRLKTSLNSGNYSTFLRQVMNGIITSIDRLSSKEMRSDLEEVVLQALKVLKVRTEALQRQVKKGIAHMSFSFIEGALVKAMRQGEWILLDEINLAEAETLECLNEILEDPKGSVLLHERGDRAPIERHPNFRLLACMNPATDVGKKELPKGIRSRFTELYISELEDTHDLVTLARSYVGHLNLHGATLQGIVKFYKTMKEKAFTSLTDGAGGRPHYSLRTLCRALRYVSVNHCGLVTHSLFEGFCMSFLTQLNRESYATVRSLILKHIIPDKNHRAQLNQPIKPPSKSRASSYTKYEGYWIHRGNVEPWVDSKHILTKSVKQNLRDLARIVSYGKHPVLIQGETAVGKTSLITYLAKATGNRCVRVNNHDHTDLQEYIGSYTADPVTGRLVFTEGILVEAMRNGYWIILDELNLAPTEVLEALNRVLDDNRELFIPEIQKTVQAHPHFMLFATQNPPGLYGGRKVLSRAFRNRFIELHFDEIPALELEEILRKRCGLPMSYSKKMVQVMKELQIRRRASGIFAGKRSFITLRDLFRWGERYKHAPEAGSFSWQHHMADEGYLLLAGRVRKAEEERIVLDVLEEVLKIKVEPDKLFSPGQSPTTADIMESIMSFPSGHLVWTRNLRRMAVLVGKTLKYKEPVLLVGETGCGKTTICQLYSQLGNRPLFSVNCHMHSESADFLGGLRPVRNHTDTERPKLFEWVDGPLVQAMKQGGVFLADEISLADDSVLERINSVLEPEQSLLLAEKQSRPEEDCSVITAAAGFVFMATMNPGGDYGKKELSPALRNRFTEIWCPSTLEKQDIVAIVNHNIVVPALEPPICFGTAIVNFLSHFSVTEIGRRCTLSVRDILSWVQFINRCTQILSPQKAYLHGAAIVFLDSIGSGNTGFASSEEVDRFVQDSLAFLAGQLGSHGETLNLDNFPWESTVKINTTPTSFGIGPFHIQNGPIEVSRGGYALHASTPCLNALRILRAMQLHKPILLEGVPGVGKTSLVLTLARVSGHQVTRINLSEQTDVSDLFGADLPVDGGSGGQFAWRDGPLLRGLKEGHWILLDELNLASQSVLEGLNACLDHRGEIFVPELGMTFSVHSRQSRIFGCQNPHYQGGARKGLPRSFLNRFTQVYIQALTSPDLEFIASSLHPQIPGPIISQMVKFNEKLVQEIQVERRWGQKGGPWELNLRDVFRWCELMEGDKEREDPSPYIELIYAARMRSRADKQRVLDLIPEVFESGSSHSANHPLRVTPDFIQAGCATLPRLGLSLLPGCQVFPLHCQLKPLQVLMKTLSMGWMAILVGNSACGKTTLVRTLAALTGNPLTVFTLNTEMDATELLGGFEQVDFNRHLDVIAGEVELQVTAALRQSLPSPDPTTCQPLLSLWNQFLNSKGSLLEKIDHLLQIAAQLGNILGSQLNLEESLRGLRTAARKAASDSSGGCFEWVDSLLVRALRLGHWLLLDDANFCSPAVLDRLNGLLEPNGRLELGERGVVGGQVPSISPHPNFRLILAMDPKNGEISRAMRNRGIEIHLLGDDQEGSLTPHDQHLLLRSMGLELPHLATGLLTIHTQLIAISTGVEKPSLLDLQAAALGIVQRINRYPSQEAEALTRGCMDAYVHNALAFTTREEFERIIKEEAERVREQEPTISYQLLCQEPSIQDLIWNPTLGAHRQLHLTRVVRRLQDDNSRDATRLLLLHLRVFLQQASLSDQELILPWFTSALASTKLANLANEMTSPEVMGKKQPITDLIGKELDQLAALIGLKGSQHIPMDLRWNMPLYSLIQKRVAGSCQAEASIKKITHLSNRFMVWLSWQGLRFSLASRKGAHSSLYTLSLKFSQGSVAKEHLPCHAVALVFPFFREMDSYIERLYSNPLQYQFSEDNLELALDALDYYATLFGVSTEPYTHFKTHLSKFAFHWKKFIEKAEDILPNISSEVTRCIRKLDMALGLKANSHSELRSKVAQLLPCPSPLTSEVLCLALGEAIRLETRLEYCSAGLMTKLDTWRTLSKIRADILSKREENLESDLTSLRDVCLEPATREEPSSEAIIALLQTFFQSSQELASMAHGHQVELLDGPLHLPPAQAAYLRAQQHLGEHTLCYFGEFLVHLFQGFDFLPRQLHEDEIQVAWTRFSPILSHAINQFSHSKSISLGGYEAWTDKLMKIVALLWANIDKSQFNLVCHLGTIVSRLLGRVQQSLEDNQSLPDHIQGMLQKLQEAVAQHADGPLEQKLKLGTLLGRLGLLLLHLLQPHDVADPVLQTSYSIAHYTHQEKVLSEELEVHQQDHLLRTGQELRLDSGQVHPVVAALAAKLSAARASLEELEKLKAYRPPGSKFEELKERIGYFVDTICPENKLEFHLGCLGGCLDPASRPGKKEVERILKEAANFKDQNILSYVRDLEQSFFQYPDLVGPCVAGIKMIYASLEIFFHSVAGTLRQDHEEFGVIETLASLPSKLGRPGEKAEYLQAHSGKCLPLRVAALQELNNELALRGGLTQQDLALHGSILSGLSQSWLQLQETKRLKEEEEECLYQQQVSKLSEEEREQKEVEAFFAIPKEPGKSAEVPLELKIWRLHQDFVSLASSSGISLTSVDVLLPYQAAYHHCQEYVTKMGPLLDGTSLEEPLYCGHLVVSRLPGMLPQPHEDLVNFYKDPNPAEAVTCIPVLREILQGVEGVLDLYPEQPVLTEIKAIIQRILNFPLTAPIAQFVKGLELILTESQHWLQYAHRGIALKDEMQKLSELIIKWRKLELKCWSKSLDDVMGKMEAEAAKLWFDLYSAIVKTYLCPRDDQQEVLPDFTPSMLSFMEAATLGDFEPRLKLLETYVRHLECCPKELRNQRKLYNVLFNVHHYYRQFLPAVQSKVRDERQPIEKAIKDYVKIQRWKDTSYNAIRDSTDKSHRLVHGSVKTFERKILELATSLYDHQNVEVGCAEAPWEFTLEVEEFLLTLPEEWGTEPCYTERAGYLRKMKDFCQKLLSQTTHLESVQNLNSFIGDIIEEIKTLQNLEVDRSKPEEDQKKQAGFISQRKRKALSDLFRVLRDLGLSYQKGGIQRGDSRQFIEESSFNIPPSLLEKDCLKKASDKHLQYFYACIARLEGLNDALHKPSKELTQGDIQRAKGFSFNLLHMVLDQRRNLQSSVEELEALREKIFDMERLVCAEAPVTNGSVHSTSKHHLESLLSSVSSLAYCLLQAKLVLDSSPDQTHWHSHAATLATHLKTLEDLRNSWQPGKTTACTLFTWLDLSKLRQDFDTLTSLAQDLSSTCHAMLSSACHLKTCLLRECSKALSHAADFRVAAAALDQVSAETQQSTSEFISQVAGLQNRVLLAIQGIFKQEEAAKSFTKSQEEADDHLIAKLHQHSFFPKHFHLSSLLAEMEAVFQSVMAAALPLQVGELVTILPFLRQLEQLYTFYSTVQVASFRTHCKFLYVLLGLFTELTKKGFCIPPGLLPEDSGQQGTEFKDLDDAGMGEGQGMSNVSDRIEDEAQLDGLQNEPKQDENEDIPEEENGIEMSHDFEGKTFDPDQKEEEEENKEREEESEDEVEAQDEMGDMGEGEGETLDKEMWGSDTEEEQQEPQNEDKSGKAGETTEENTLQPKDESATQQKESSQQERKETEDDVNSLNEDDEEEEEGGQNENPYDDSNIIPPQEAKDLELPDQFEEEEQESGGEEGTDETATNPHDIDEMKNAAENQEEAPQEDPEPDQPCPEENSPEEMDAEDGRQQGGEELPEEEEDEDPDQNNVNQQNKENPNVQEDMAAADMGQGQDRPDEDTAMDWMSAAQEADNDQQDEGEGRNQATGHQDADGESNNPNALADPSTPQPPPKYNQPTADRTVSENPESKPQKAAHITDAKNRSYDATPQQQEGREAEAYEHVRQKQDADTEMVDFATEEQAQKASEQPEEDGQEKEEDGIPEEDEKFEEPADIEQLQSDHKAGERQRKDGQRDSATQREEEEDMDTEEEDDRPLPQLEEEKKPVDSYFVTQHHLLLEARTLPSKEAVLQSILVSSGLPPSTARGLQLWRHMEDSLTPLVQELCEQLRIVLEPSKCSKLQGDYRTGKRLNMRKVIPYLASHFRKDKIWLRRTKPHQRQYQIVLAVDNSKSMTDFQAGTMALEAMVMLSKSLQLLEAGKMAVLSFGEQIQPLLDFKDVLSPEIGASILEAFTFNEASTRIVDTLDYIENEIFLKEGDAAGTTDMARLLIIISDGINFAESDWEVKNAVRRARDAGIFVVFIVMASSQAKTSLVDLVHRYIVNDEVCSEKRLEKFPFPYYVILQNLESTPMVLGEALRQWFELVSSSKHL